MGIDQVVQREFSSVHQQMALSEVSMMQLCSTTYEHEKEHTLFRSLEADVEFLPGNMLGNFPYVNLNNQYIH